VGEETHQTLGEVSDAIFLPVSFGGLCEPTHTPNKTIRRRLLENVGPRVSVLSSLPPLHEFFKQCLGFFGRYFSRSSRWKCLVLGSKFCGIALCPWNQDKEYECNDCRNTDRGGKAAGNA
jgi:hypothetical protein